MPCILGFGSRTEFTRSCDFCSRGSTRITNRRSHLNRRKSLLLVATDLSTGGGVNRVIRDLSSIFAEDLGFETLVVSARSSREPTYPFSESVRLEQSPQERSGLLAYLSHLLKLRRRRFDFAIGFWTQDNLLLLLAFLFSGTRVIVCEHLSHFNMPRHVRFLRRILYHLAWRVTVLNRA